MSRSAPLLAALLLLTGCGDSKDAKAGRDDTTGPSGGQQKVNDGGSKDARGLSTVEVAASNFTFSPSAITGTPGQKLHLVVKNTSKTEHNIKAASEQVDEDIEAGESATVTLTVPASGRLVFVCEYHAGSGMAGTLSTAGSTGSAPSPSAGSTSDVPNGY